ncbi:MAG: hypothetical protein IPO92_19685 [Saprospiraceae bacterium]|nr:hypothetical protein [Saprospiraceae bacterium]
MWAQLSVAAAADRVKTLEQTVGGKSIVIFLQGKLLWSSVISKFMVYTAQSPGHSSGSISPSRLLSAKILHLMVAVAGNAGFIFDKVA